MQCSDCGSGCDGDDEEYLNYDHERVDEKVDENEIEEEVISGNKHRQVWIL